MDWKTFIATMTGHLAWPLSVLILGLVLMWLLRKHLAGLIERLEELTLPGGFALKLARDIQKGRDQSEAVASKAPGVVEAPPAVSDNLKSLANDFPAAAIVEAFKPIEAELITIREKLGLVSRANLPTVMRELSYRGLIEKEAIEFFDTLRRVRNTAAHAKPVAVSPLEAVDYAQQTAVMLAILQKVSERLEASPY